MIAKTVKYQDFNGNDCEDKFYFNLTKAELTEMELGIDGGLAEHIQKIVKANNGEQIIAVFKKLILKSYGIKSEDGERFVKRAGNRRFGQGEDFTETMAYESLYMEMIGDINNFINFVRAIIPEDIRTGLDNSDEYKSYVETFEKKDDNPSLKLVEEALDGSQD